jgi:YD repeat-containing protein
MLLTLATNLASLALTTCTTPLQCPLQTGCLEELGPASDNGEEAHVGYDVNTATGNLHLSHTDIRVIPPIGPVLELARFYNNQENGTDVGFGANWTHSFSWSITVQGSTAELLRDDGRWLYFVQSGTSWTAPNGEFGTLTGSTSTGFVYTTKTGTALSFDTSGRLTSIDPADDTAISISYSSGTLINQVSSGTKTLTFHYDGSGHITSIGDGTYTWSYAYSGSSPTLLSTVTFPNLDSFSNNGETQYVYAAVTPVTGTTFDPGTGLTGQITEIEVLESAGVGGSGQVWVPVAYFGYTTPASGSNEVTKAAAGLIGTTLLRYTTFSYTLCYDVSSTSTATVTVAGGSKTVTSTELAAGGSGLGQVQRLSSITSTAGSGMAGELPGESYTWNASLTLASFTNGNGHVRSFTSYDAKGNPTSISEASDTASPRVTTFTYHSVLSRPLSMTRNSVDGVAGHSHVMTWDYDSDYNNIYNQSPTNYLHQIVETGYTDGSLAGGLGTQQSYVAQIHYNANNQVSEVDGPLPNAKVTYGYFASGTYLNYLTTTAWATSSTGSLVTTINSYDAEGREVQVAEPNGTTSTYTFDQLGRPTAIALARSGQPTLTDNFLYDLAGDLLTHTTPEGTTLKNEFDAALRLWRQHAETAGTVSTPWSTVTDFDSFNRPVTVRKFSGLGSDLGAGCTSGGAEQFCREMAYDAYRRISYERTLDSSNSVCSGSNCEVLFTYDGDGNIGTRSEAGLNVYTYYRDAFDRLNKVLLPTGKYSTVTYDINDHLITRHDPKDTGNGGSGGNRLTTYLNDDFGRLIKVVNPDIGAWISNYDQAGNMTASQDATPASLTYSYDFLSRRTGIASTVSADSVTFGYDQTGSIGGGYSYGNGLGRLTSILAMASSGGSLINSYFAYDYVGRPISDIEGRGASGSLTYAAVGYTWQNNGEPATIIYPDGLVATLKYPSTGGYAPTPLPNEIDVPFSGSSTVLVSGATRFADGVVNTLSYGSGSNRTLNRNKRGEFTSLVSGPSAAPWLNQTYQYDANGLGELDEVNFNPGLGNAWQWTFGYDSLRRLTSYTTNVRPTTDSYTWNYDEIGNRTSEVYNGATTTYHYDSGNITSHLLSLTGATSRTWTYNANGDVAQDHWTGASGVWNQYSYSTRHRVAKFDYYNGSTFQYTTEAYQNDGLERRWQKANHTGTWVQFYYDLQGRVLEEYQNNLITVNGCPAYTVVDHVYLGRGASEVARAVRQFQSSGGCSHASYSFVDKDILYVHEDYRNTAFADESKSIGSLAWEAETSPFGVTVHQGLPGSDGKIGTTDDLSSAVPAYDNDFGLDGQFIDSEFNNLASNAIENIPAVDRRAQPQPNIGNVWGMTPYNQLITPESLAARAGVGGQSIGVGAGPAVLPGGLRGLRSLFGAIQSRMVGDLSWLDLKLRSVAATSATPQIRSRGEGIAILEGNSLASSTVEGSASRASDDEPVSCTGCSGNPGPGTCSCGPGCNLPLHDVDLGGLGETPVESFGDVSDPSSCTGCTGNPGPMTCSCGPGCNLPLHDADLGGDGFTPVDARTSVVAPVSPGLGAGSAARGDFANLAH